MRAVRSCGTQMCTSASVSLRAIAPPPLPVNATTRMSRSSAASIAASTLAELRDVVMGWDYRGEIAASGRSGFNRILQPVELRAVDRDHVEAAWRRLPVALQVNLGGEDQARLLGRRNAGRRAAMAAVGALAHFD